MADQGPVWKQKHLSGSNISAIGTIWVDSVLEGTMVRIVVTDGGVRLSAGDLRALIAELTRRAALLAGESGEEPVRTAEDERASRASALLDGTGTPPPSAYAAAFARDLQSTLTEADEALRLAIDVAKGSQKPRFITAREAVVRLRKVLAAGAVFAMRTAAQTRTEEEERADVVAWLIHQSESWGLVGYYEERLLRGHAEAIKEAAHVGAADDSPAVPPAATWSGPGHYAGRDAAGRPVLLHAETPAGLARIGAAAGVARWSGPHASLADAGKALDAEARYRAEDAARWERREREEGGK